MLKKLICKIFGHKEVVKVVSLDVAHNKIVRYCKRCKRELASRVAYKPQPNCRHTIYPFNNKL